MPALSPERSRRGVASRRKIIVDDDDSDIENAPARQQQQIFDEDDFTPEHTTRHRSRASESTISRLSTLSLATQDPKEPSQLFSPPQSEAGESLSPSKKSPPKRRSIKERQQARKSRGSRLSVAPDTSILSTTLPSPRPTRSPESESRHSTPLADITESTVNERAFLTQLEDDTAVLDKSRAKDMTLHDYENASSTPKPLAKTIVKKIDPDMTILDRPMDIVVKTRQLGLPAVQEQPVPKARMTITYLILTNFKSYAGRQEVGPFHASFSSVVGPNGSGKSNVIDSLLFVFGFRASKMRQGKISALIHNSAQFPDLDHCEVEVHFQMVEDQLDGSHQVVPGSQLVVSRRAFKNNSSAYYINGKTSNFTAVTSLLRERGVDLDHKRFLILQGEVEAIAQMKPKAGNEHEDGLLEYLEDIIGTSKYKAPIDEAAAETEALNEVCLEKSNRVQHVEKEKNNLEGKKNKALAYIHDENELALKQSALYQIFVAECGDNLQVTEEAIIEIQEQLKDEMQRHKGSEDGIKRLEAEFRTGSKDLERLEKETQSVLKELAKIDKENVKIEEKKKFLATKMRKLEKTADSCTNGIRDSQRSASNAAADVTRLIDGIQTLEQEMAAEEEELQRIRESLKGKTQGLSDEIASRQRQLEPWNAKINEKRSAMAVSQSELEILCEQENAGAVAIAEAQQRITDISEQRQSKASELEDCTQARKTAGKELARLSNQIEQLNGLEQSLKAKLSSARQKADEARSSFSNTQSQSNVLSGLWRLKESGRIEGFHGRLGNLGAIDQKYDVAISTACPSLENLVVDTVEVGQQCIEYLRKNNLGRANFILLDRLPQRDLSHIQTPENVPRLFDLVKSKDTRFLPALYSVLQNTLVATDLEQASRIAYGAKRWRVVTLDGQLIDKSGTMSGGGTKVARGAMSSRVVADVSKDQVVKMETDRDSLEQQYSELQQSQRQLEAQMQGLQNKLPFFETQAQKLALELDSIDRNISDTEKRVQELAAEQLSSQPDKAKVARLKKAVATFQSDVDKLQSETAGIEEEIQALQDQIMEIGGIKLRTQKSRVDGVKEQIDSLQEQLSTAEVTRTKSEKQQVKHERAHADAMAELERVTADQEKAAAEVNNHAQDTSDFRKHVEEAQSALEEKKEELEALRVQLDEQVAELNETRGAELEMRNKLEENEKVLLDNQKRSVYWQEKLGKLLLQNVSEDGEEREPQQTPELSRDEMADMDKNELKAAIASLEERTSQPVETFVLGEYRRRANEYTSRAEDLGTALASRDAAKKRTDDLRRLRLEGFMEGFSLISMRLKEMYQMITMGGNAELELVDSLDPFSEGILFSVMPPKKSWKNISNLSGGEKTLSSLALVFALHHYKPTPLYVMDEIDAALDFRNVSIVAAYIKERTKNAQFIVISLRNNMFELASRLVGVYKVNHMTKSVTVENRNYINAA
ncbi:RecF/RecN/SMC protein [Polychaeton citri CBS 116435]|uniref:Structural maintenance of chromosomes protein n=1 Tax=Polychaeton citri CBS 116435 TaxID=1314669 RepID=A0A9P4Q188_9PEZI|nr:RecF/RecN/SMC protein [Polychaeton citri CBS 116435]